MPEVTAPPDTDAAAPTFPAPCPAETCTSPANPNSLLPDPTYTIPDCECTPAVSPLITRIDPELLVAGDDDMDTEPEMSPEPLLTATLPPLAVVAAPPDMDTSPPEAPLPAVMPTFPLAVPSLAAPTLMRTSPDFSEDIPLDRITEPESPSAGAVEMSTVPEIIPDPDDIDNEPPTEAPLPPSISTAPPRSEAELPPFTRTAPPSVPSPP